MPGTDRETFHDGPTSLTESDPESATSAGEGTTGNTDGDGGTTAIPP
jgi:hypothetical protein